MHSVEETVDQLLLLIRGGDRSAAGRFMTRFSNRIRARMRSELSPSLRRVFDSQDLISTVSRRLDAQVSQLGVTAESPDELWSLVYTIARNSLVDKARVLKRLQRVEAADSDFAVALARRLEVLPDMEAELEIASAFEALDDADDRQILSFWLTDTPHEQIALFLNMPAGTVRWRWSKIRARLREIVQCD